MCCLVHVCVKHNTERAPVYVHPFVDLPFLNFFVRFTVPSLIIMYQSSPVGETRVLLHVQSDEGRLYQSRGTPIPKKIRLYNTFFSKFLAGWAGHLWSRLIEE